MAKDTDLNNKIATLDFSAVSADSKAALTELIRHLARTAADNDYKEFLKSGRIPYAGVSPERSRP